MRRRKPNELNEKFKNDLQIHNGFSKLHGIYYAFMKSIWLPSALAFLLPALSAAEDEPFDPPAPASSSSAPFIKSANEDIDLFLKGLNEARDDDAQLADASPITSANAATTSKKAKTRKNKRIRRSKGGV